MTFDLSAGCVLLAAMTRARGDAVTAPTCCCVFITTVIWMSVWGVTLSGQAGYCRHACQRMVLFLFLENVLLFNLKVLRIAFPRSMKSG